MSTGLSKSRLMSFQQCPRKLWLSVHARDLEVVSSGAQSVFDSGHEVGELARRMATAEHGQGTLIDVRPHGWTDGVRQCIGLLDTRVPQVLFEAPFVAAGVGVIADIVLRDGDGTVKLIEVKSSTSLKGKPHVADAAIQAWTMSEAGYPPDRIMLRLIDSEWVYPGDGNYAGLFKDFDVTDEARSHFSAVPDWIRAANETLLQGEPEVEPGKQCSSPFPCGFSSHCQAWDAARKPPPSPNPVAVLLRRNMGTFTRAEKQKLKYSTYADVADLPADFPADERTRSIVRSIAEGGAWVSEPLADALAEIPYPLFHFDFETIAFAVPRWKGTRPYQQVPFQWSCHIEQRSGEVAHHEFLDLTGRDPREECARRIVELMGAEQEGAVVVYSQSFEETRIRELARDFPQHAAGLQRVLCRLVDLLPIYRAHYFHPDLEASWSIKKVLPTVAPDLHYGNLVEVQDGGGAQRAYLEATTAGDTPRTVELRERMLAYCGRDTEAMLRLVRIAA